MSNNETYTPPKVWKVIFSILMAESQQLLEHDGHLDAIWRRQRMELQETTANRKNRIQ